MVRPPLLVAAFGLLIHHAAAVLDVVAELHALEQRASGGDNPSATRLALSHMPPALVRRLSELSLSWDNLSGFLQRALLWDMGLVHSADGRLVQVFVPCGKSMLQIFLSKDVFRSPQCGLLACNPKNMRFASRSCSHDVVAQLAQCAIQENVTTLASSSLWSEDGSFASVPDIRVFRASSPSKLSGNSSGLLAWFCIRRFQVCSSGHIPSAHYLSADLTTLTGKADDGLLPVMPLPKRTNSCNTDCPTVRSNAVQDEMDLFGDSFCREAEELAPLSQDPTLASKRIPYSDLHFTLLLEKRFDRLAITHFANEIRLASCLSHPNIVRFLGHSWQRVSDLCIVSEFMERGDLSDLLGSKDSGSLRWASEKMCIAIDVACALTYLHSLVPLIIHRDLKSHNVLLNEELRAKISDFGLSRERSFEETMTNGVGTMLWTAPEILRGEAYTEKADIFSYGIVLSELDTCLPPYSLNDEVQQQHMSSMQLMHLVTKGAISPRFRSSCPPSLEALARRCVSLRAAERPSAAEIVFALRSAVLPELLVPE
ncbi:hypothetical protein ATCC90586_004337 [Pythium insidiosum]|nr:hypothetical protein ATCC90586_004337 [Pythium insidiosum]